MPRIRYQVAASLDGFIAGPNGEYDWLTDDPTLDLGAYFAQFDTFVMGRKTYELTLQPGNPGFGDAHAFVFSRTLPADVPKFTVLREVTADNVAAIRAKAKKDIWLFGGGELFRSFLRLGLVDTVEIAVMPTLVGGGVPLLPPPAPLTSLRLTGHRVYPSGIVMLEYDITR